jgi:hypothetical protein
MTKDQRANAKGENQSLDPAIARATCCINETATQALPLSAFYPQSNREQGLKFGI